MRTVGGFSPAGGVTILADRITSASFALSSDNGGFDAELRDGDFIYVPKKLVNVSVVGKVVKPGLVLYKPGKSYKYYVDEAGGYDKRAFVRTAMIYRIRKGAWVSLTEIEDILPGDVIYIPERPQDYYWNRIRDIIAMSSGIVSVAATIFILTKYQFFHAGMYKQNKIFFHVLPSTLLP